MRDFVDDTRLRRLGSRIRDRLCNLTYRTELKT